jgi:hypothetical protein
MKLCAPRLTAARAHRYGQEVADPRGLASCTSGGRRDCDVAVFVPNISPRVVGRFVSPDGSTEAVLIAMDAPAPVFVWGSGRVGASGDYGNRLPAISVRAIPSGVGAGATH